MRRLVTLSLIIVFILASCSSNSSISGSTADCGNGKCENGENSSSCVRDCPVSSFSGRVQTTVIKAEGSTEGSTVDIAVMVASPTTKRYTEGAGVVVVIPPLYSSDNGFIRDPNLAALGLVQVTFAWPGQRDGETGLQSGGKFDYGGPDSMKVLRDVIRFAGGRSADMNGRYIFGLTYVPPLTQELGLYAFGDAGLAAVKVLSLYGDQFQGLTYLVGREIVTTDALAAFEAGYYASNRAALFNPLYSFPSAYGFDQLNLNYTNLRWDGQYTSSQEPVPGRPYLDLDGSGSISSGDFVFDGPVPFIDGKLYYSRALTRALLDTGALQEADWPADLASPAEANKYWQFLLSTDRFPAMLTESIVKNLKVMLVFARQDHAQVAEDKPHIHQAYQGLRFESRLWVRLNPDRSYVQDLLQRYAGEDLGTQAATPTTSPALDFPDNPANTQPQDWSEITDYAYPGDGIAGKAVPLAAVAEMADRAHSGYWDENIGQVIYPYTVPTPTP